MSTIPVTDPHKAWNVKQFKRLEAYNARLQKLLDNAIKKAAAIAMRHDANASDEHLFSFSDDRQMKSEADKLMKDLSDEITSFTQSAKGDEWEIARQQATEYIGQIYNLAEQTQNRQDSFLDMMLGMRSRNEDALIEFNKRKIGGLNLSKKVWGYTQDFERQLEVSIDTALMQGMSASNLALSIQSLLKNPDDLFRRVRDKNDQLRLSKAMKAYHPGTGKYRSAYKNALRLARSEINIAYRTSDSNMAQMLDCVVGIQINLSNNHTNNGEPFTDICDQLAGKYPKDFKFVGWHPQCRCFITYILKSDDEFWEDLENGENNESVNTVDDVPDNFKKWVTDNKERIANAKEKGTLPYFLRDNKSYQKEIQSRNKINTINSIPTEFTKGSTYDDDDYVFSKDFFDLIDKSKPIRLEIEDSDATSLSEDDGSYVLIADKTRRDNSEFLRHAVVYHEYGHCIDAQRELWKDKALLDMRMKHISELNEVHEYPIVHWGLDPTTGGITFSTSSNTEKISFAKHIDNELDKLSKQLFFMSDEDWSNTSFGLKGLSKSDISEQIGATSDTLKSLVLKYGYGHDNSYFNEPRKRETEYIAHAFENTFVGNEVFESLMPSIYRDMIAYIKSLRPI